METRFGEQDEERAFWKERVSDTILPHMCHTVDRSYALPMLTKIFSVIQDYIDKTNTKKGQHSSRRSPTSGPSATTQVSQPGGSAGASPFMPLPAQSPSLRMSSPFDWGQYLPSGIYHPGTTVPTLPSMPTGTSPFHLTASSGHFTTPASSSPGNNVVTTPSTTPKPPPPSSN